MGTPTNCHTDISDTVISADDSSPSQGANQSPRPTMLSRRSDTPHSGEIRLHNHAQGGLVVSVLLPAMPELGD